MANSAIFTAYDSLNRPSTRTYEANAPIDAVALGAKLQVITALAIPAKQKFVWDVPYAAPTAYGATSSTATGVVFLLEITRPSGDVEEYKDIFPCIKPTLYSGTTVPITADITAWYDNFKVAGKLRLADGSTVNRIIKGYAL